jgi:protein-tyrosine-phosphatase
MRILFICKYNRFRSKVAEALFNKYNKDKKIEVKSAGTRIDITHPNVSQTITTELKSRKAKVTTHTPVTFDDNLLEWADKIIVAADDVNQDFFPKWALKKIDFWKIPDCHQTDLRCISNSSDIIEHNIKQLIKKLNA